MNELTHALAAWLLPPTGALPLLLLAWWLKTRRALLARVLFLLGLMAIWLGSTELGAQWLQGQLVGNTGVLAPQRLAERPAQQTAIVVLGAGADALAPEYQGPQLKPLSVERLRYGIWLARQCACPMLMSGGVGRDKRRGPITEAQLAGALAREQFGFQIRWLEDRADDTRGNARYSAALLRDTGITRVVLVTHEVHMPRAMRAFRAALPADVDLLPAPVDVTLPGLEWRDALPSSSGMARARYLGYEWLGWVAGH